MCNGVGSKMIGDPNDSNCFGSDCPLKPKTRKITIHMLKGSLVSSFLVGRKFRDGLSLHRVFFIKSEIALGHR
jgi:hypothetical protein